MARGGAMYARAARREAMKARLLDQANGAEPSDVSRRTCPYCGGEFTTPKGRNIHISLNAICHLRHEYAICGKAGQKRKREYEEDSPETEVMDRQPPAKQVHFDETALAVAGPSCCADTRPDPSRNPDPDLNTPTRVEGACTRGYTKDGLFIEQYPVASAGAPISAQRTNDEDLQQYLTACGRLGDRDLFETAAVMMTTGLTGQGRTKHLNTPAYRDWKRKGKEVWNNSTALLKDVDRLPTGPAWQTVDVTGGKGRHKHSHTLYMRDILEVIRELLSARRFRHCMHYAPERHWTSKSRRCRVYDEMWSGEWWWRMQDDIQNESGMVVPLIIASDETTLTNNPNGDKAHPIYLSIGNISKAVRRRPTKQPMIIIGYLPVDSFDDVEDKDVRSLCRADLFHRSLDKIFEPLKDASSNGVLAWCADGYLRHIYPLLAAWIADYPEQNTVVCTTQSGCPKCVQRWEGRGGGGPIAPLRNHEETRQVLRAYQHTGNPRVLRRLDLRPIAPFWDGIPRVDVSRALVPDLLHQLYKGMFEHVRDWVEDLLGTAEFNRRFKTMPSAQGLRHFKKGVTKVKVWAGRESRDMMRQFLPIIVDAKAPHRFIRLVRALLDFSYLAHQARLTDAELAEMDERLEAFHKAKGVLVDQKNRKLGIVEEGIGFDRIPKLHMLGHYTQDIREFGTPDGYSTETPEHLHIMYVKIPWRMSNRRNPLPQMVEYVRRLEAIEIQRVYIEEFYGELAFDIRDVDFGDEKDGGGGGEDEDGEDDDDEDGEESDSELEDAVEVELAEPAESDIVFYPRPVTSIARQPTVPNVPGSEIMSSYGASEFIRALRLFLSKTTPPPNSNFLVLPSDRFPVWHKAVLNHTPLPFALCEPCHRDVVRAHPPARDAAGRVTQVAAFDTALFATNDSHFGVKRYRAGRVRVIFALPPDLVHLYNGPLVYLDVFEPFSPDASSTHRLFGTMPEHHSTSCSSLVLPLSCLKMSCHLAPDFTSPSIRPTLLSQTGPTNQRFLFNEFYNHFTFLLLSYWRRLAPVELQGLPPGPVS